MGAKVEFGLEFGLSAPSQDGWLEPQRSKYKESAIAFRAGSESHSDATLKTSFIFH